jgi:hypothetical protein
VHLPNCCLAIAVLSLIVSRSLPSIRYICYNIFLISDHLHLGLPIRFCLSNFPTKIHCAFFVSLYPLLVSPIFFVLEGDFKTPSVNIRVWMLGWQIGRDVEINRRELIEYIICICLRDWEKLRKASTSIAGILARIWVQDLVAMSSHLVSYQYFWISLNVLRRIYNFYILFCIYNKW